MTVFVVQQPPAHISFIEATDFGELYYLLPKHQQITNDSKSVVNDLTHKLKKFNPDKDYLLCYGDPAAIGIACAIISRFNEGHIPLIKWDRQARQYYSVHIDIP